MLAVDTNVLVRYVVADDPGQAAAARELVDAHDVWVSRTVLLECEWVLRGAYGFPRPAVGAALRAFAGLPTVTVESPAVVGQALDWLDDGMDFADALHLAAAHACTAFATFDRRLAAAARKVGAADVRLLGRGGGRAS